VQCRLLFSVALVFIFLFFRVASLGQFAVY
jgi:hypothetical protein